MDLGINDKVALVGASGGGLGFACAKRLYSEGCKVVLCDKDENLLADAVKRIGGQYDAQRVMSFAVDLTKADEIDKMFRQLTSTLGQIDILVTNSGGPPPGTFDTADDEKWLFAFDLTFMSAVRLIRGVLPGMKDNQWGRIINLCSRTLREPIANLMISNAVRLAVAGMAKTLSTEIAHEGVTVNNIGPGPTVTHRAIQLATARAEKKGITVDEEMEISKKRIPRGRMAEPEEIASAVAFLSSDQAGHITGQSLLIDGGETKAL